MAFLICQFLASFEVIVNTFNSPSCLVPETAKGPFGLRVKLSAVATGGQGGVPTVTPACAPVSVYSEYVCGTAPRNDKTTDNIGKWNNNVQT